VYQALELFWQPNRRFDLLSAHFLEAQREESYGRAEGLALQCLVQAQRARSNQPRLVCQALDMLCTALLAQGKLDEAESAARQLMEASRRTMLSPPELRPPARTLAHVLLRRHKVDEAEALLRKLQDSTLFREYPLQRGAVLGDLASLEAERDRPARAAEWNTRAIHLLESHDAPERDLAVLYMNRGDNYAHSGDQSAALADYQKAIFLHERCEPESTTLALLLSNAGVAALNLGQPAEAE
jgi:tetratricopeptide (TPR) repeat protein